MFLDTDNMLGHENLDRPVKYFHLPINPHMLICRIFRALLDNEITRGCKKYGVKSP